ncbi:hypothetical protein [Verrucosispora sioxanthis]|uniref:Uncharacterized protein n=1 Tax=Verrucosispora sioxanthis TaxID=2499994 RepID=A0A6M1KZ14_9ACTN|nr:hypothetical protein [Verrucosispora sioxanthis]NEE65096.1 hypothetical protein [Verrucosispora sioxanthis]NGM14206.1 hypothetical protein [Verrucosispora sioxanthis]
MVAERLVVEDLGWHRQIGEWVEAVVVPGVMWGVEELAQRAAGAAKRPEYGHTGEGLAEPGWQQVPVAGAADDVTGGARGERRFGGGGRPPDCGDLGDLLGRQISTLVGDRAAHRREVPAAVHQDDVAGAAGLLAIG